MAGMSTAGYAAVAAGEDWHYVGEAGEPAFENSWGNLSGDTAMAFRIRESGVVDLQGAVTGGSPGVVFTLPAGYRPSQDTSVLAADTSGPNVVGIAVILQNGSVIPSGSLAEVHVYGSFFLDPPLTTP